VTLELLVSRPTRRYTSSISQSVTHDLLIAVSDAGTPRLTSYTPLHVVVSPTRSSAVDVTSSRRSAPSSASGVVDVPWWLVAGACLAWWTCRGGC